MNQINSWDKREAIRLCDVCIKAYTEAERQLGSASHWGIVDVLGGNRLSNFAKHSSINTARGLLEQVRPDIERLGQLTRTFEGLSKRVNGPSGSDVLADYLFDGIFVDIYMQTQIGKMREQIRRALETLGRLRWLLGDE